jgi:hypothetical protein
MRTLQLSTLVAIIILACTFSCSKPGNNPNTDSTAGKGGSANVTMDLKHHGVAHNLIKCTVYVKYNTSDAPSNGIYDDSVTTTDADTMQTALFPGLKNGNYYFYGRGCDTSIFQQVTGGIPFTVSNQAAQSYVLPVSENGIHCN